MKRWHCIVAAAGALGLGVSVALAQQDRQDVAQQQEPATPAATEAAESAEPRSDEEVLTDHLDDFLARVEARRQASEASEPPAPPPPGIQYHPAW